MNFRLKRVFNCVCLFAEKFQELMKGRKSPGMGTYVAIFIESGGRYC